MTEIQKAPTLITFGCTDEEVRDYYHKYYTDSTNVFGMTDTEKRFYEIGYDAGAKVTQEKSSEIYPFNILTQLINR